MAPALAEEKEVTPAGAPHLTAKRRFSEGTAELQQMLDFGNCPLHPTALLGERVEELSGLSFHFISPLFPWAENAFFLTFPAQPDSQARLISVVGWPHFAAMPVSAHLPKHQHATRGSALGKGKKPATFQGFQGVPACWQPPKVPFRALGNPHLPPFPWDSPHSGEVTSLARLMLSTLYFA